MFPPSMKGKYQVIYADPPWRFKVWGEEGDDRSPEYKCEDYDALSRLGVSYIAADDCVLLMWVIDPMLPEALKLIEAWGFEFKTVGFYWAKLNQRARSFADFFIGLGYWTRANPEMCLLATRGKPTRLSKDVSRLIVSPRREHSRKPDATRERIERLLPGPYVELFARTTKPGWDCWGNETSHFQEGGRLF